MLDTIQRYVSERRRGIVHSAVFLCGSYALSTYVSARAEETKDMAHRNKVARDNLRRRFQSTHDDVCFTIMALMPTLASQVLEDMDVEALTNELQSISRASRSRVQPPSDLSSSVSDVQSDAGSVSMSSYSGSCLDGDRPVSGSWIENMSASESSLARPSVPTQLSDSITSLGSTSSHNGNNMENSVTSTSSRTRGQLWNEVKILSLTRTLTTVYTITLLSLLTAVQLNLLGRSRYIDSVRISDRDERALDDVPDFSLVGILAREAMAKIVDVEAAWPAWILGESKEGDNDVSDQISEETELRFLTLSWWLLHVGWKDVAARVRGSVESVFDEVSLKVKLSSSELFSLFMDVRRRVETDGSGSKLGARFLSSLLPPTPETTAHVLAQGGAPSIPGESDSSGNIDRFLSQSLPPLCDAVRPLSPPGYPSSETPDDTLSRSGAIAIENPVPRPITFPTPPSSHAHGSDLGSRTSQSPSTSPVPRLRPAPPTSVPDSLGTSRNTLDVDSQFNALLTETHRYLSGPNFAYALGCALDRATEILMDGLRARVFVDTGNTVNAEETLTQSMKGVPDTGTNSEKKDEVKVRLAGLLPGLARWCQLALNSTPNELIDNIMAVREVNALEAIVMSDYEDRFPGIP